MRKVKLIGILFFLCFVFQTCRTNKPLVNYEVSFIYNPDKSLTKYKYLDRGDSLELFVSIDNPSLFSKTSVEEFRENHLISYSIFTDISKKHSIISDSLTKANSRIYKSKNTFFFNFSVPKIENLNSASVLLFRNDKRRNFLETDFFHLDYQIGESNRNLVLKNETKDCLIFKNFISLKDSLSIIPGDISTAQVTIDIATDSFLPAIPPHIEEKDSTRHFIKVDTIFTIPVSKPFLPLKTGLYLFKKEPNLAEGYPVLVTENRYPRVTTVEEMIDPLIYITNRNDFKKIKNSRNPKASLDSFWLRIGGNKDYTRSLIKSYYEKVEYANLAFTSHKEGWKTDRGMIYIVFGKPDEVYKSEDSEDWVYENVLPKLITFTFVKSKDFSSLEDYDLHRVEQFKEAWYSAIEKWRNGTIKK